MTGIPVFREEYMRPTQTAFPDLHHVIDDLFFDGDKVAMRFSGRGTHEGEYEGKPATGKILEYGVVALFRLEGNLIAEVWGHSDWAGKLAEL